MPPHAADYLSELAWRGLLFQHTEAVGEALARGQVSGYCGFDPTASSLHVGSLVPIMGLVHLQRAGHRPVALVGGGTGMIGDPSGKSAERQLITREQVAENVRGVRGQLERFLDFQGPNAARVVDNGDWLLPLDAIAFMRDVGKHFTVNYMLQRRACKHGCRARAGSVTPSSATCFCRRTTTWSSTGARESRCRWVGATSGGT